jgi:hypothetical protein
MRYNRPLWLCSCPFHSTTYVGQIMAQQYDNEPDKDLATRTGALAMLIHSIGMNHVLNATRFKANL